MVTVKCLFPTVFQPPSGSVSTTERREVIIFESMELINRRRMGGGFASPEIQVFPCFLVVSNWIPALQKKKKNSQLFCDYFSHLSCEFTWMTLRFRSHSWLHSWSPSSLVLGRAHYITYNVVCIKENRHFISIAVRNDWHISHRNHPPSFQRR